ncbi:MAG: tetratricopeptide repeat protein [Xanthomonadales bacterium]|nr:tetratricopeptide repeat protein [Xanthomonadales bacterium]
MIRFRFVLIALLFPLISCAANPVEPVAELADVAEQVTAETQASGGSSPDPSASNAPSEAASMDEEVMYRVMAAEMRGNDGDMDGAVGDYLAAAMESTDPQVAMRATRVAFAAEAWQQASMAADRWALLDPENLAAHESAALSMLATADYAGAEMHLLRLLELAPDKNAAWDNVTGLLGRSASPEKASKVLENLLQTAGEENNAAVTFAQSQLAVRLGDFEQAYKLAAIAVELDPGRESYLLWAGQLANRQDDKEQALAYTRQAWELDPDGHDITLAYADMLAKNNQPQQARELVRNMDQTPDILLTRILFELSGKDRPAALEIYQEFKVMDFENSNEKAFYLGQSADALGLYQEAIDSFANIRRGQFFLAAMARTAELKAQLGDIEGARETLAILRRQPDDTVIEQSWLTEAQILQQAGQSDAAIEVLDQALLQFTHSTALRYSRALVAAEQGNIELAEADLMFVLAQDAENAAALNALGYTLADQTDRLDEAEALIYRAYQLLPDDAAVTDSMGWIAFRQGRLDEAESYLRQALRLDDNPEIAAHLGEVLWELGRKDEARLVWDKALESTPDNEVLNKTLERLQP